MILKNLAHESISCFQTSKELDKIKLILKDNMTCCRKLQLQLYCEKGYRYYFSRCFCHLYPLEGTFWDKFLKEYTHWDFTMCPLIELKGWPHQRDFSFKNMYGLFATLIWNTGIKGEIEKK